LGKALISTATSSSISKRRADRRENRKRATESRPSSANLPVIIDPFPVPNCGGPGIIPLPRYILNLIKA